MFHLFQTLRSTPPIPNKLITHFSPVIFSPGAHWLALHSDLVLLDILLGLVYHVIVDRLLRDGVEATLAEVLVQKR